MAILLLLQTRGRVTVGELSRELEASERTIRRDLDALSAAGIPVLATRGRGGGWELLGGHRTDLSGLSAAEAEALFLIAGPEAVAAGLGVGPKLRSAVRKLMAALPAPLRERADTARSRLLVDPSGWGRESERDPGSLAVLREAVLAGVQVDVTYASPGRSPTERRLHPYGLVAKAGNWYLLAGAAGGMRTFRVSRMERVAMTAEPAIRPDGFDLAAEWERARAEVPAGPLPVAVELLADPRLEATLGQTLAGWARLERGEAAGVEAAAGERRRLIAHLPNPRIAALELSRFTGWVEVLGPEEVRRELARLGAELVALHAGFAPPAGGT